MGSTAGDSRDVNVLEIGRPLALLFREGGHGVRIAACGTVYVVALENDGFVFDVGHHDVRDIQLFGLATTSDAAFEAKTSVGARDGVCRLNGYLKKMINHGKILQILP